MSFRKSHHVDEREKSPFHFGWMKRSKLLYMHVIDEGRGEFRTATGAGDECREVLHGVFGFGGALEQQNSGVCEYSLYVDNQTDIPQETEAVQNC